jgi:hypothetical protein
LGGLTTQSFPLGQNIHHKSKMKWSKRRSRGKIKKVSECLVLLWLEQYQKLATASYIDRNMRQWYKMKYCKRNLFFTYNCIHICMDDNCINHD